jgi:hypothetical protein
MATSFELAYTSSRIDWLQGGYGFYNALFPALPHSRVRKHRERFVCRACLPVAQSLRARLCWSQRVSASGNMCGMTDTMASASDDHITS